MPPPSVSPAIPVVEMMPPVVARPNACVAWLKSPHVQPPSARTVLAAASNGDWLPCRPALVPARDHVRDTLASDDRSGSLVDHRVIDLSSLVVLLVTRPDDFPTNLPLQFDDRLLVQNRSPLLAADLA